MWCDPLLMHAFFISVSDIEYPEALVMCGLTKEVLAATFQQILSGGTSVDWQLSSTPTTSFYRSLHCYLKKWPVSSRSSKISIGKFYIAIDAKLQARGSRPDNVYRLIERISRSQSDQPMNYGNVQGHIWRREIKELRSEVAVCNQDLEEIARECEQLREQFKSSQLQLRNTQQALRDVTNENLLLRKKRDVAEKKAAKCEAYKTKYALLEEEFARLQIDNIDMSLIISELESEVEEESTKEPDFHILSVCSKTGQKYPPEIRKLYYSLLASQIPVSKVEVIIKAVLRTFHPSLDVDQIHLPKKSCASYMRKLELKTISNAHKSTVLCEQAAGGEDFHLNTDGTTKSQKKLGGVVVNDMVISVNHLADGTAKSAVSDVSRELEKLRKTASALGLPNPDSINWSSFVSSSSDSASTQKRVNTLVEEYRQVDAERFASRTEDTLQLVENICSMHLGVNLRKAFQTAINEEEDDSTKRKHLHIDTIIHEFCKLLGKYGVPEYTCGVQSFPDFLTLMSTDPNADEKQRRYYQACSNVALKRQIGSRYFVSAANASKICFLKDAVIEYLRYTGKNLGNKLERAVYTNLQDPHHLTLLRADGLMFYHVYADLTMLSKSNHLAKTALDMNQHYLELKMFLQEAKSHPEILVDSKALVFVSEGRLYGPDKNVNHRLHTRSQAVYKHLFVIDGSEEDTLYPVLVAGVTAMEQKLCSYAWKQLPGGTYWDPEPPIKDVLSQLKPTNDVVESVLGLNDYLTTAVPNLHQLAQSNLVEVKKNKSLQWLNTLPEKQQEIVLNLAIQEKQSLFQEYKEEEEQQAIQRRQNMLQAHSRREALKKKAHDEKERLLQNHLISSTQELSKAIEDIESESISASKKKTKIISLIKTQMQIRKKVLNQDIHIVFSHSRKQRPVSDILKELSDFIDKNSPFSAILRSPETLVGQKISHKFEIAEGETKWYDGIIVNYDANTKTHEIAYDYEDEPCHFDISIDVANGDLLVLDDPK